MNVLYINYVDLNDTNSGSSVRPQKILNAFKECDYNVYMLTGSTLKVNKQDRIIKIKEAEKWLDIIHFDFCYIESPSGYIVFKEDRKLIKKINKKNILIGYFYRDIYYKFGKEIIFKNNQKNIFSKKYLRYLFQKIHCIIDEFLIKKYVDVVFLPSDEMKKYLKFKNMVALPPAGEKIGVNDNKREGLIYVGGLSERYGTNYMLEAIDYLNKDNNISLTIICRKKEVNFIDKKYLNKKWLKIVHCSGDKLAQYYNKTKIALIPQQKCEYNEFAISVKLFEYMSYNVPIVCTNCQALQKIVNNESIGVVSDANDYKKFANDIKDLYYNDKKIKEIKKNIKLSLEQKNLWIHRIKTIENNLRRDIIER